MENFIYERASIKNLKEVQLLNNELFKYEAENKFDFYIPNWALGEKAANYFKDLISNQYVEIVYFEKSPIGYLAGSITDIPYYQGKSAELENMFIKEEYRKLGIGSKLVNNFVLWTQSHDCKRVFITASQGNVDTIKFYQKKGFEILNTTLKKELL